MRVNILTMLIAKMEVIHEGYAMNYLQHVSEYIYIYIYTRTLNAGGHSVLLLLSPRRSLFALRAEALLYKDWIASATR